MLVKSRDLIKRGASGFRGMTQCPAESSVKEKNKQNAKYMWKSNLTKKGKGKILGSKTTAINIKSKMPSNSLRTNARFFAYNRIPPLSKFLLFSSRGTSKLAQWTKMQINNESECKGERYSRSVYPGWIGSRDDHSTSIVQVKCNLLARHMRYVKKSEVFPPTPSH